MSDWMVYCPSYKRSKIAISHKLFQKEMFTYVVREEEKDLYSHLGVNLMTIPKDAGVKDISTTRNWILNNKKTKYLVTVDDDMKSLYWIKQRKYYELNQFDIIKMIEVGFQLSEDCGAGLWGLNVLVDPMAYRQNMPISFSKVILGPFMGILDSDLKYDERLPLKEDYDFFLQQLNKHRKCVRLNMFSYQVDHQKLEGGCQTYRSLEREEEQNILLRQKWGSNIIKDNHLNPDSINMIIRPGI